MKRQFNAKLEYTCLICSKIYNEPIELPCGDTICAVHLKEAAKNEKNHIKCLNCSKIFPVKGEQFSSNKFIQNVLKNEEYLSDEEKNLKHQLENFIESFIPLKEKLLAKKSLLTLKCYNHFQELRRQIDLHRECMPKTYTKSIREKLNTISFELIDKVNDFEFLYVNSYDAHIIIRSFQDEKKDLCDLFLNPNTSLDDIKQFQVNITSTKVNIESNLKQIDLIQSHLAKNKFKPCHDSIKFGHLVLFEYPHYPFESQILTDKQHVMELKNLCGFSNSSEWSLLYRASRDGFGARDFHSRCDDHANTLTIFKAKNSGHIFGGYTNATWSSLIQYKYDPNAFIFSLTNKENQPCKMVTSNVDRSIRCSPYYGPSFGSGCENGSDIFITFDANVRDNSYTFLGGTYKHAKYERGSTEVQSFLAGSYRFRLEEIEVFKQKFFN
jgi:hypothetical protein